MTLFEVVLAVAVACALAAAARPVLRRLPAPRDLAVGESVPDWTALGAPAFVAGVGLACLAAGLVAGWRSDGILWVGVTTAALAVGIDARTTWLPRRLAQAAWLLTAAGVAAHAAVNGDPGVLVRAVAGAAAGGGLLWLGWRFLALGFGDVRLMTVLAGTATAHGWGLLYPTLLSGAIVGALWGIAVRVRGGRGAFAYGPGLWLGALAALALA